jgi:hypothetical protein
MRDKRLFRRRTKHYKDVFYTPKNLFQPKPREYYESLTDIKLSEERKEKLERIWKQPTQLVVPDDYLIAVKCGKKPDSLIAFVKYITPRRRMTNDHYIYLVKKKPNKINIKGNYLLSQRTRDAILPIILQAIDNETL